MKTRRAAKPERRLQERNEVRNQIGPLEAAQRADRYPRRLRIAAAQGASNRGEVARLPYAAILGREHGDAHRHLRNR